MKISFSQALQTFYLLHATVASPIQPRKSSIATQTSTSHQTGGEHYIVLFNHTKFTFPHVSEVLSRLDLSLDHQDVHTVFNGTVLRGFSANMKSHCVDALNDMSEVAHVEQVQTIRINVQANTIRQDAPWGLQRISSTSKVSGDPSSLGYTYTYDTNSILGAGVDIYIIDSGINTAHKAFQGRAQMTSYTDVQEDDNGHGTHVSGTAAAAVFGVASGANVYGMKVLDKNGTGPSTLTLQAISDIIDKHTARKTQPGFVGSVINMSWDLSKSDAVNAAISMAIEKGIHAVVAAGNDNSNACNSSPASSGGASGNAITVGAISMKNTVSTFSNTGPCVDVYAPGEDIVSTWIGGDNVINILSGTSMAAPHVTGLVAYLIVRNQTMAQDPVAMKAYLRGTGLKGALSGKVFKGDPVILVNNGKTT